MRLVPPITTAAIASSSNPLPALGSTDAKRAQYQHKSHAHGDQDRRGNWFAIDMNVVTEKKCAVEILKTAVKRIRTATRPRQFSRIARAWRFRRASFSVVAATDGADDPFATS
jgi:hypothetical protein